MGHTQFVDNDVYVDEVDEHEGGAGGYFLDCEDNGRIIPFSPATESLTQLPSQLVHKRYSLHRRSSKHSNNKSVKHNAFYSIFQCDHPCGRVAMRG